MEDHLDFFDSTRSAAVCASALSLRRNSRSGSLMRRRSAFVSRWLARASSGSASAWVAAWRHGSSSCGCTLCSRHYTPLPVSSIAAMTSTASNRAAATAGQPGGLIGGTMPVALLRCPQVAGESGGRPAPPLQRREAGPVALDDHGAGQDEGFKGHREQSGQVDRLIQRPSLRVQRVVATLAFSRPGAAVFEGTVRIPRPDRKIRRFSIEQLPGSPF